MTVYLETASLIAPNSPNTVHGHSREITPGGDILCEGTRDSEELLIAELDPALMLISDVQYQLFLPGELISTVSRKTDNDRVEQTGRCARVLARWGRVENG